MEVRALFTTLCALVAYCCIPQAVRQGKPFAVVPCCVFRSLFPHRLTPEGVKPPASAVWAHSDSVHAKGAPVAGYAELCDHLAALSPRIRTATLDIPGRNTVLYMLPEDTQQGAIPRSLFSSRHVASKSAKNRLQEHLQGSGLLLPEYVTESVSPPFTSTVRIGEQGYAGLEQRRKKDAEEDAARAALEALGVVEEEEDDKLAEMLEHIYMCRKT